MSYTPFPLQVSPKRLDSSDTLGVEITYQHEESIKYDEVSSLLQKVMERRGNICDMAALLLNKMKGFDFFQVDWPPRRQSRLQTAVENSFFLATLRAHHSSEDKELIGFARIGEQF